jgi:hypothetical protein
MRNLLILFFILEILAILLFSSTTDYYSILLILPLAILNILFCLFYFFSLCSLGSLCLIDFCFPIASAIWFCVFENLSKLYRFSHSMSLSLCSLCPLCLNLCSPAKLLKEMLDIAANFYYARWHLFQRS